ncbi:MAG: TetR/AcrR family transcriptional regulator [Nocardioides sp.]
MSDAPKPSRTEQRKTRTRAALVKAASSLLAEGRTDVSIQQITDLADVGFGSFYNHFGSKDELFEAAVQDALIAHSAFVNHVAQGVTDAPERFALGVRLTCRMQRQLPEMVRVVLNTGTAILTRAEGLGPQARGDIEAGMASGRFRVSDLDLAFMVVGGALLGALEHLDEHPDADADLAADRLAESLLQMLGVASEEAHALAYAPLPSRGAETA